MQTFPIQSPYPFNNRTVYVQRTPAPVVNRVSVIPDATATLPIQPRQFLQPPTVIETPQLKNHFVIYRSPCEKVIMKPKFSYKITFKFVEKVILHIKI